MSYCNFSVSYEDRLIVNCSLLLMGKKGYTEKALLNKLNEELLVL